MISLFAVVDAYGQSNCPTCPKGMTAPSSVSSPLQGFNGYTSEVRIFDGTTPTCYTPTANTLNGHLRGINNALCVTRARIDSLRRNDTVTTRRIDSLINAIEEITDELSSTYNTSIISSDSTLRIVSAVVGSVLQFNVKVNMDTVKERLVRDLDYSCLGVAQDYDAIMNKLIEVACLTTDAGTDDCVDTSRFYSTNTIGSTAGSTTVSITPHVVGSLPSGSCVSKVEYIYTLLDGSNVALQNGVVNGSLGTTTNFTIPIGYVQGARSIRITSRYYKERCVSTKYCGIYDSTVVTSVPVFSLSALVANNDIFTNTSSSLKSYSICLNDVTPYPIATSKFIQGASKGVAVIIGCTVQYTALVNGIDTLRYEIEDIYGQKDTAYIYITNTITLGYTDISSSVIVDTNFVTIRKRARLYDDGTVIVDFAGSYGDNTISYGQTILSGLPKSIMYLHQLCNTGLGATQYEYIDVIPYVSDTKISAGIGGFDTENTLVGFSVIYKIE